MPSTQKADVNAVVATGIEMDPNGMREMYMDNRFTAPELFVFSGKVSNSGLWYHQIQMQRMKCVCNEFIKELTSSENFGKI